MTARTKNRKWPVVLFFGAVGLVLGYFVTVLISASSDPGHLGWTARPQEPQNLPLQGDSFILPSHQQQIIGEMKITYRGIESGTIVFDLVLMDLDPQYAYLRRIPIESAKRGFRLSSHQFKLESAGEYNMQISRTERSPTTE